MTLTPEQIRALAKTKRCPRCEIDKTMGTAMCRSCRSKLPPHMRAAMERLESQDAWVVGRAIRAAANYFNVHFQSVKNFGGGKKR